MKREHISEALSKHVSRRLASNSVVGHKFSFHKEGTYFDLYRSDHKNMPLIARVEARKDLSSSHGVKQEHALLEKIPNTCSPRVFYCEAEGNDVGLPYRVEQFYKETETNLGLPIHQMAKCLATLHSLDLDSFSSMNLSSEPGGSLSNLLTVEYPVRKALVRYRNIASDVKAQLDTLARRVCLVHGDVHFENFLNLDDRLLLVDWEHACLDDPAIDVAQMFSFPFLMKQRDTIFSGDEKEHFLDLYIALTGDVTITSKIDHYMLLVLVLHLISWDIKSSSSDQNEEMKKHFNGLVEVFTPPITEIINAMDITV